MRHVPKWAGLLYVVLVAAFLSWYVTHGHQVDYLVTLVTAFTTLVALPAAVIAVLRPGKTAPAPTALVSDQLAQAVRQQWETEAQLRRLNDPFPLPVEWTAADADLVESWPRLKELAEDWPGHSRGNSTWAVSPRGLAGKGGEIAKVFERVPTRRLIVLGEPGSGKTMLLIRLLLALLEDRSPGGPVPVLFSLASWSPAGQDLYAWMADQLTRDHPALGAAVPAHIAQTATSTHARALLEQRLIVPILDGLDELPQGMRARALHAINQVLPARQPLVLSSRTAEYRDARTTPAGITVLLNGAAGIRLLPLDPTKATAYLERDAGGRGTQSAARWKQVTASLGTDYPVAQALSTPLGLFLASTIYNPRPDDYTTDLTSLAEPDELLDQTRFSTRHAIETHLFAAYIPAVYRAPTRWDPEHAKRILTFLANHLEHTRHGTPDLAWWQLQNAVPKGPLALVTGCTTGLVLMIPTVLSFLVGGDYTVEYWAFALIFGLTVGLGFGSAFGWAIYKSPSFERDQEPNERISWKFNRRVISEWVPAVAMGMGIAAGAKSGLAAGFAAAFVSGSLAWLAAGITTVPPDPAATVRPRQVLTQDRRNFWIITLLTGSVSGLAAGLLAGIATDPIFDRIFIGLIAALLVGLSFGCTLSGWWKFVLVRLTLGVLRKTPLRLMGFLADAHERRGVLRQSGAVYQFRHRNLQRHLAASAPTTRGVRRRA
ncbi:NACHT domain-containing protein [Streptomyces sp. NPDC088810]|uniref:NACHT domain-containing protein n=1 Tax=Streptomyces sp. NPDC088810 TaxID=3365904 RepID=UPI003800349F